jgi:hypothetical protein
MIVAIVAVIAIAIATIWYLSVRGSPTILSEAEFNEVYDDLVAKGEAVEGDREAAWLDFHAEQVQEERDRLTWDDAADE